MGVKHHINKLVITLQCVTRFKHVTHVFLGTPLLLLFYSYKYNYLETTLPVKCNKKEKGYGSCFGL